MLGANPGLESPQNAASDPFSFAIWLHWMVDGMNSPHVTPKVFVPLDPLGHIKASTSLNRNQIYRDLSRRAQADKGIGAEGSCTRGEGGGAARLEPGEGQ